jgi:hypothetical protein
MMVCKTWYLVGKPYLYQDIDIRRPTQLFELLVSLKKSPENTELVKGLHVSCFIGPEWAAKFSKTLQSIIDRLPDLLRFTLKTPTGTPENFQFPSLMTQKHGLTISLDMGLSVIRDSSILLQGVKAVMSAKLVALRLNSFPLFMGASNTLKHLQLSSLETIEIGLQFHSQSTLETWRMPCLRQATLFLDSGGDEFRWFLERHGQQIERLQLWGPGRQGTVALGQLCPNLQHLVLSKRRFYEQPMWKEVIVSHPNLTWIDVWLSNLELNPSEKMRDTMLGRAQKTCPALQGMRLLDFALVHLPNLPFLLSPFTARNPQVPYEIQFFGFHLRHASWCVVAIDQPIKDYTVGDTGEDEPEDTSKGELEEDGDWEDIDGPGWSGESSRPLADDRRDRAWRPSSEPPSETSSEFSDGELEELFGTDSEGAREDVEYFSSYDSE